MVPLFKKLEDTPFSKRILIYAIIPALGITLFTKFFYLPHKEEINGLEKRVTDAKVKLERLKKAQKRVNKLNLALQQINKEFYKVMQLLPNEKEIPDLLSSVSSLGNKSHLEFLLFEPRKERPKNFYAEVPIKLDVVGRYLDIEKFLREISRLSRIINIASLKFGSPKMRSNVVFLKTEMEMIIYRFIPVSGEAKK